MSMSNLLERIKDKDQSWKSFFTEIFFLIGMVLFIRFYVFQFFRVSGPSMCPTLNHIEGKCFYGKGEFIFVNEFVYHFIADPKPGEIVIFTPPGETKKKYIKRIIAGPGETVHVINGEVYREDEKGLKQKLQEKYLSEKNKGRTYADKETFVVPDNHYLLFGDNRNESLDARKCFSNRGCNTKNTAFVHKKEILGKAEFTVFPFESVRKLDQNLF